MPAAPPPSVTLSFAAVSYATNAFFTSPLGPIVRPASFNCFRFTASRSAAPALTFVSVTSCAPVPPSETLSFAAVSYATNAFFTSPLGPIVRPASFNCFRFTASRSAAPALTFVSVTSCAPVPPSETLSFAAVSYATNAFFTSPLGPIVRPASFNCLRFTASRSAAPALTFVSVTSCAPVPPSETLSFAAVSYATNAFFTSPLGPTVRPASFNCLRFTASRSAAPALTFVSVTSCAPVPPSETLSFAAVSYATNAFFTSPLGPTVRPASFNCFRFTASRSAAPALTFVSVTSCAPVPPSETLSFAAVSYATNAFFTSPLGPTVRPASFNCFRFTASLIDRTRFDVRQRDFVRASAAKRDLVLIRLVSYATNAFFAFAARVRTSNPASFNCFRLTASLSTVPAFTL